MGPRVGPGGVLGGVTPGWVPPGMAPGWVLGGVDPKKEPGEGYPDPGSRGKMDAAPLFVEFFQPSTCLRRE